MSTPEPIDVSGLPDHAFGHRDPAWWGLVLLIAIEATSMMLMVTSYFYLRGVSEAWPPAAIGPRATAISIGATAALVLSCATMLAAMRAARRKLKHALRVWMIVTTLLGFAFMALRSWEIAALPFRWTAGAYGSLIWTTIGLHTFHAFAGAVENVVFTAVSFSPHFEERHFVDADLNGLFWLFVLVEWSVPFAVLYGEGLLHG
jgi:heme/copper-type cytochrome/quinol oxidase subunit 3